MRITPLMMSLLLGACTISSTGGDPASVECTTGADGQMICTQTGQDEDRPDGDDEGEQPGDTGGETACASEECTIRCEEGGTNEDGSESTVEHCVIECANGLRCDQVCNDDRCALYCTCPEEQPDPTCEGDNQDGCPQPDPCEDRPEGENCQPEPDYCDEHPEAEECQDQTGDDCENSTDPACCDHPDEESHEQFCQEHPDAPEC